MTTPLDTALARLPHPARALEEVLRSGVPTPDGGTTLPVRRAWPGDLANPEKGHVLELAGPDGAVGAILQPNGTAHVILDDARLPRLLDLRGTHRVLAHPPAKRAVLRAPGGDFVKLARPTATRTAVARLGIVEEHLRGVAGAPERPRISVSRPEDGELHLRPCAGRSVTDVVLDSTVPSEVLGLIGRRIGSALLALASPRPTDTATTPLLRHEARDEAQVLRRWVDAALAAAPLDRRERSLLEQEGPAVVAALTATPAPSAPVLAHRDLHAGQMLTSGDSLAVLDWDTAAWADPGLDTANLVAHLDRLARLHPERATPIAELVGSVETELVAGGHPAVSHEAARMTTALYRRATELRLVAVHAFRPRRGGAAR